MIDRITSFEIAMCKHDLHDIKFAVIAPGKMKCVDASKMAIMSEAFIDFNIGITPNVPVVMFEILSPHLAGSPVFNVDFLNKRLYHLPPRSYQYLEDIVSESAFLVSQELVVEIFNMDRVYGSIFHVVSGVREKSGLVALGYYDHASEKS